MQVQDKKLEQEEEQQKKEKPATISAKIQTSGLNEQQKEIFIKILNKAPPIPPQTPDDWIPCMKPGGQSLKRYLTDLNNKKINKFGAFGRKTIYIAPLNRSLSQQFLKTCAKFIQSFYFGSIVKIHKPIDITKIKSIKKRKNHPESQSNANDILNFLQPSTPKDAFCTIAITSMDLYHKETWNFIFGLGRLKNRVGVFSFARYDPRFFDSSLKQQTDKKKISEIQKVVEYRSCKVMVHEIGHMFGMKHCIYYACLMQGSMNDEEADQKPLFLCPICLMKLRRNMQFNLKVRGKSIVGNLREMKNENILKFVEWYQWV